MTAYWFPNALCDSCISGLSAHSDVTGIWTPAIDFRTAPAAAQSAGVYLNVHKLDDAGSSDTLIEEIVFGPVLFRDGF